MRKLLFLFSLCIVSAVWSQEPTDTFWHLSSYSKSINSGIGWERGIPLVTGKESKPVVIAVIDAGVDIHHPDLKDQIWINEDEVNNNGIDDDNNGYVDDRYGWNFLGDMTYETLEITREYVRLNAKYELNDSTQKNSSEYTYYQNLKAEYLAEKVDAQRYYEYFSEIHAGIEILEERYTTKITQKILENSRSTSRAEELAKLNLIREFKENPEFTYNEVKNNLKDYFDYYDYLSNYGYNPYFNVRTSLVGDDPNNAYEKGYGNNKLNYGDKFSSHGTHVAGIIASNGSNDFGAKGVCSNCLIMTLRVVPEGDERDKDVANAILYAADNGAQIINMSFGKNYAYNQIAVRDAIVYAKEKGVLFVHAAGNEAEDNDEVLSYPNDFNGEFDDVWIEVGASSWTGTPTYIADFSNYGLVSVDVFAPGVSIYSTTPDNQYQVMDGTSMAAPVVSGIAGVLWSYYPNFTAAEIKTIIIDSSIKIRRRQQIPGKFFKARACRISKTGSIVNLFEALKLAESRSQ